MSQSATQTDQLVKMANHIALNMGGWGDPEAVAAKTMEHMTKFWTPSMREQLRSYWREGGEELSSVAVEALRLMGGE